MRDRFVSDRSLTVRNLLDVMDPEYLGGKPDFRNLHPKKTEKEVFAII